MVFERQHTHFQPIHSTRPLMFHGRICMDFLSSPQESPKAVINTDSAHHGREGSVCVDWLGVRS